MKKRVDRFRVLPITPVEIVPVRAGYQNCDPNSAFGECCRNSYTIHYVYSGQGTLYKNNQEYRVSPKEIFVIRPNEAFSLVADSENPWCYIWIGFRTNRILVELEGWDVLPAKHLESFFLEIANCNSIDNYPLEPLLVSYIWKFLSQIKHDEFISKSYKDKATEYIPKICQLIERYYATITVDELATYLNLNRSYMSRIFKQHKGITIIDYRTTIRMQIARELLFQNHTIEQISEMVGYTNANNFSRAFKEYYDCYPSTYIKTYSDGTSTSTPSLKD